jgi:hypothetical protein
VKVPKNGEGRAGQPGQLREGVERPPLVRHHAGGGGDQTPEREDLGDPGHRAQAVDVEQAREDGHSEAGEADPDEVDVEDDVQTPRGSPVAGVAHVRDDGAVVVLVEVAVQAEGHGRQAKPHDDPEGRARREHHRWDREPFWWA